MSCLISFNSQPYIDCSKRDSIIIPRQTLGKLFALVLVIEEDQFNYWSSDSRYVVIWPI